MKSDRCKKCLNKTVNGFCVECFMEDCRIIGITMKRNFRRIANQVGIVGRAISKNLNDLAEKQRGSNHEFRD